MKHFGVPQRPQVGSSTLLLQDLTLRFLSIGKTQISVNQTIHSRSTATFRQGYETFESNSCQ
jgi:hypothetical protein